MPIIIMIPANSNMKRIISSDPVCGKVPLAIVLSSSLEFSILSCSGFSSGFCSSPCSGFSSGFCSSPCSGFSSGFCSSPCSGFSSGFCSSPCSGFSSGSSLSFLIQFTVAVAVPILPASSINSNVKLPFSSNLYVSFPKLLVIVTFSLNYDIVAVTG